MSIDGFNKPNTLNGLYNIVIEPKGSCIRPIPTYLDLISLQPIGNTTVDTTFCTPVTMFQSK